MFTISATFLRTTRFKHTCLYFFTSLHLFNLEILIHVVGTEFIIHSDTNDKLVSNRSFPSYDIINELAPCYIKRVLNYKYLICPPKARLYMEILYEM